MYLDLFIINRHKLGQCYIINNGSPNQSNLRTCMDLDDFLEKQRFPLRRTVSIFECPCKLLLAWLRPLTFRPL